jgi:hypothetical protein
MHSRIILPILLAAGLLVISEGQALSKSRKLPPSHHTTIETVSTDSITIDSPDGTKTYKITKDTEITFKGDTVTADQLQPGMSVDVTPDAVDETVAGTIVADDPPHDPPARKEVTPPAGFYPNSH